MPSDGYFDTDRRTEFWYDLPATVVSRKPWSLTRAAKDIQPQRVYYSTLAGGLFNSGHAVLMADDAWVIQPYGHEPAELLTTEGESHVGGGMVNLAPNHRVYNSFRQTTVPGAGQAGNLLMTAAPTYQRRRTAGSLLSTGNLDADAAALPPPTDPGHGTGDTLLIPADRVLSGTVTYGPNQPFLLTFQTVVGSQEIVFRFYFGGATEVTPAGKSGGQFCLTLRGDGRAILREFDATVAEGDPWKPIYEFAWGHKHAGAPLPGLLENNTLCCVPYSRNRMAFYNLGSGLDIAAAGQGFLVQGLLEKLASVALSAREATLPVPVRLYRHSGTASDHLHLTYMTGPGTIRADRSRTDRLPFQIVALKYRPLATLIDAPFDINVGALPTGTHLTLTVDSYTPPGTSIIAELYDATTNVRLLRSGLAWLTNANQNRYYARFELHSDADPTHFPAQEQTSVLFSYTVECPAGVSSVAATPKKTQRLHSVNVTGSGAALFEETALMKLVDEVNEAPLVRYRDQMHSKLVIVNRATGVPISVLFEGQTVTPHAKQRGFQDGQAYPSPDWHDTDLGMAGMWARIFRQFNTDIKQFASSQDSPHPAKAPDGSYLPWRITDLIRWAFNSAGVPDSQLDIPDSPLRFPWTTDLKAEDYAFWPGTPYGQLIETLVRDFLGQLLIRCPNSGPVDSSGLPAGMWRVLLNPKLNSTNFLFTVNADAPVDIGVPYFPMTEGAQGAQVYPVREGSFDTWPRAPEGNVVIVRGFRDKNSDDGTAMIESRAYVNPAGFDPASPDYLEGDAVLVVKVFEGFAMTPEAVDWAARILYQRVAFGEKWWQAVIPLPLIFDPLDVPTPQTLPRPPRINDLIQIKRGGTLYPAIIRSCNPCWDRESGGDGWQWVHLEGKFRDPALEI